MSARTLNQLIASVITGADDAEVEDSAEVVRTETAPRVSVPTDEVEKLASALEFVGQRGVESFFKVSQATRPPPGTNAKDALPETSHKRTPANTPHKGTNFQKKATAASEPPPGTNYGVMHKGTSGSYVTSTKAAPPMRSAPYGKVEDNDAGHPGGTSSADTTGTGHATHHPVLSSNEAAINASPTIMEKHVAPALSKILNNAGPGHNHQKMKMAHNIDEVREELARRVAAGRS